MKDPNQTILEPAKEHAYSAIDLPEGWVETTLDHLLQALESGSRPKGGVRGITEGIPSIGGEHLNDNGGFRFEAIKFVPYSFFEKMKRGRIQNGDILIVKDGATTGKVSLVRKSFPYDPAVINEHVFICRPAEGVCPSYLFYFLFSKEGQDRILANFRGSAQGGINQNFASGTAIRLAPTAEQKRIAESIEYLLDLVNSAQRHLSKITALMKSFRQNVLAAAYSGHLTANWRNGQEGAEDGRSLIQRILGQKALATISNDEDPIELPEIPKEWSWSRCEYLCEPERVITYGVIKLGPPVKNGIQTLRSSDVRWLYIDDSNVKRISTEIAKKYSRTALNGDEILVTVRGTLGGVAVVPQKLAGSNISREVAMIPLHPEFNSRFFCYVIAAKWSQNWLSEVIKGVAYSGINIRDLKRLPLPVPPITEQREISNRIDSLFKLADFIEERQTIAALQVEKLTRSILSKAFHGELVPTEAELARREGRSYEHASALLVKIKELTQKIMPRRISVKMGQQKNNGLAQRDTIYSLARESDPRILASVLEVLNQYGALPIRQISLALRERGLSFKKDKAYTVRKEFEFLGWIKIETELWEFTSVGRKIAESHPTSQLDLFTRTLIVAHESMSTQGATKLLHKMWHINPVGQGAIIIPQPQFQDLSKGLAELETGLTKELERWNNALKKEMQGFQFLDASKTVNHIISQSLTKWADLSSSKRRSNLLRAIADRYLDMMFQDLMSPADVKIWQNRLDWGGITHTAQSLSGVAGHVWFPTGSFRTEGGKLFTPVEGLTYEGQTFYRYTPKGPDFLKRFGEVLYEGYIERQREEQVEYVSLLAVRDWACYRLRISHAVFEENLQDFFPRALRGELPITLALEVDITPSEQRQLGRERPVIIDGTPRYIVAMRYKK